MTTGKRLSRRLGAFITMATVAGCPAAAAAKEKLDSFAGSCSVQGTSAFSPPATNSQQPLSVHYTGTGKCTGTLNGRQIADAPVSVDNRAENVDGSCMRAKTTTPGPGSIAFGDGTTIRYAFEFDFTATEGEITLHGERSGSARGHGSFLTPRTPPDIALQCAGAGAKEAPLDITLTTESPLVSKRAGGSNPPPADSDGKGKRLRLNVRPRSVEAGRRTSFAFRVTRTNGRAVEDAIVRFAGKESETGDNGTARIAATLREAGSWRARATKRGVGAATTTVEARRRSGDGGKRGPTTFSGSCQFSGDAAFNPPLTNNPQPVAQAVDGRGTCNGTFVDRRGRSHTLNNSPVRFLAAGRGESSSCAGGTATETGRLVFTWDDLKFKLSETRTGGNVLASLTGANGGSATATAGVSQSEDPVAIVQKCGGSGLDKVRIDGQLTTTDSISG